ncbi:hypothetical protein DPMN_019370 [Dreissena polymorpha]|uniref:Uncharacterized protein n=1 Tax=Dreissena polymorpha TaxID=45954 RepID=A0A9D4NJ52_DREPO|nr:hypothetical protein DPMN_019370 [Dreissena polymorpha]
MTEQHGINGKEDVIRGGGNHVQVKMATSMPRLKTLIAKRRVCSGSICTQGTNISCNNRLDILSLRRCMTLSL